MKRFTFLASALALGFLGSMTHAATVVWSGASGTDTNWSTGGNWSGTAPGSGDDVKFFDAGASTISNINNKVDASFGGTVASLQFGNTNGAHTTYIANSVILNIAGTGGLTAGTLTDNGSAQVVNATVTGPGTLNVSNKNSLLVVDQGRAANGNGTQRATLDMSGLMTFNATISRIGVGTTTVGGANNAQNATGTLKLGQTNVISTFFAGSPITAVFAVPTNAVDIGSDNGNAGGVNFLYLGQANTFYIDSIGVGMCKATASMLFNSGLDNPSAYFRGTNGNASRIRFWTIGDMSSSGSSSATASGTNDFSGGTVDILVDTMSLARDRSGGNTGTAATRGLLTFTAGTIDVNNLYIGNQQFTATGNVNPMAGVVNVSGSAALLRVNANLVLGRTSVNSAAATNTTGTLNITNGTVLAGTVSVGAVSLVNVINMDGGTLIVSNTLATNAAGLKVLAMTDSTLGLTVTTNGSLLGLAQSLSTGGLTNLIQLAAAPVIFPSYPRQIALIKYTTLDGAGFNFGLTNIPAWASGAYLLNNTVNGSIDLVLPGDPRPVITAQPGSYSGAPGSDASFTVGISGYSVAPLTYQWFNGSTLITDGATGNGSTVSGATTATLAITNAQEADGGYYVVIVSNAYGSVTSAPPAVLTIGTGDIPPSITGPNNQTAIQGNNATFNVTVTGLPSPALQWQRNGVEIPGETSSTLIVNNVQYATDNSAVFSLVATNTAGSKTNSATLTVIVPPAISVPPASQIVTNTQSATFSVTASGVPAVAYQWNKNGSPISGATSSTYTIASASPSDMANYSCTITNLAGVTNTANVALTVNSTMSATALSPNNNATGICYDTPLYVTFSQKPVLRQAGKINIYNTADSSTPVATVDLSLNAGNGTQARINFPGDAQAFNYYPVIITGNTAAIYLRASSGLLTSNQTYYVVIDNGVFADTNGAYFAGIAASNAWQFTTKPGGPADPSNPVVNADGSGDFVTVQGAVDSLSATNDTRRIISIRNGTYFELVNISGKHNVALRGQSRAGVIVKYPNNASIAPSGTTHARMAFKVNANDVAIDSLTITNSTPQGGSQAEALMIESAARRCIVNNCDIASRQDTILANVNSSQAYFYNSKISGNFDYIWGGGNLYFENCVFHTLSGASSFNLTAARTDTSGAQSAGTPWVNPNGTTYSANGFSFVRCTMEADSGVSGITLAGSNGTAGGVDSWAFCKFDTGAYVTPSSSLATTYVFWQFQNTDLGGSTPVSFANVQTIGVTNNDPRLLAATNAIVWFYGWQPALEPVIVTNPVSQTVNYAAPATFTVAATGIPSPTYQWQHAGTNLDNATSAALTIASATAADAGDYTVIVTTPAGSVTSAVAVLTVNPPSNTAPVFTAPSAGTNIAINVGVNFSVACTATDADSPAQTLTYSLLAGPSGAAVNSGNGNLTWRPTVAQAGSTNTVSVVVTDDGTPNLSATNTFTVSVNVLSLPTAGAPSYAGGQFNVTIDSAVGPDYALQSTTNLASGVWTTIATTNSPAAMPVILTDPNAGSQPMQFYRIVVGPPLP